MSRELGVLVLQNPASHHDTYNEYVRKPLIQAMNGYRKAFKADLKDYPEDQIDIEKQFFVQKNVSEDLYLRPKSLEINKKELKNYVWVYITSTVKGIGTFHGELMNVGILIKNLDTYKNEEGGLIWMPSYEYCAIKDVDEEDESWYRFTHYRDNSAFIGGRYRARKLTNLNNAIRSDPGYTQKGYFDRFGEKQIWIYPTSGQAEVTEHFKVYMGERRTLDDNVVFVNSIPSKESHLLICGSRYISVFQERNHLISEVTLKIEGMPEKLKDKPYPDKRKDSSVKLTVGGRNDRPGDIMGINALGYAQKQGYVGEEKKKYEWLHRIAASINRGEATSHENLLCGTYDANTQHIIYEDYAKKGASRIESGVAVRSMIYEDTYSPPKMMYGIVKFHKTKKKARLDSGESSKSAGGLSQIAVIPMSEINFKLRVQPSKYARTAMAVSSDLDYGVVHFGAKLVKMEETKTKVSNKRKRDRAMTNLFFSVSGQSRGILEATSSRSLSLDEETLENMFGLVAKIQNFEPMTKEDVVRFYNSAKEEDPAASELFLDPSSYDEIPSTEHIHTGEVSIFNIECELRTYYSTTKDRGYFLAELRPKTLGESFVFDLFPSEFRDGIKERLIMKIADVEGYMYGEGSPTEVRAAASITFEAIGQILSFVPNLADSIKNMSGSLHLYGDFGLPSGTFVSVASADNVTVTAAMKDISFDLSEHFSITKISIHLQFFSMIDNTDDGTSYKERRLMSPSLSSISKWHYGNSDDEVATLDFTCGLYEIRDTSSAYFHASIDKLMLPFGGIVAKDLFLGILSFSPLSIDISFTLIFGSSTLFEFILMGSWNKEQGFDVALEVDETKQLTIGDLISFHHNMTEASEPISEPTDPMLQGENTMFKNILVRYKSSSHDFKDSGGNAKEVNPGLTIEADMTFGSDGNDSSKTTTLRVLMMISKEAGVTVEGILNHYQIAPSIELENLDLLIHLSRDKSGNNATNSQSSYIQGSSDFILTIPGSHVRLETDLLVHFGAIKYVMASLKSNMTFGLRSISPSLSFLDFSFPFLRYVYSDKVLRMEEVLLLPSDAPTLGISSIPEGSALMGTAHWSLFETLFGVDLSFDFLYKFGGEDRKHSFSMVPSPISAQITSSPSSRMSPKEENFDIDIRIAIIPTPMLSIGFDAGFNLFGQEGIIEGGLQILESALIPDSFEAFVFGDIKAVDGNGQESSVGFPLCVVHDGIKKGNGVTLVEVKAAAMLLPTPDSVEIQGKVHFGEGATAVVAVQLSEEDPGKDAVYINITDATLTDVMHLSLQIIGFHVDLPIDALLNEIQINKLKLFWAPEGILVLGEQITGFGFEADLIFFGVQLKAAMIVDETNKRFNLSASIDPIDIIDGSIALTGSGGKHGPFVTMDLGPEAAEFVLDCAMKFLFISTDCDMKLRFPSQVEIRMFWQILGLNILFELSGSLREEKLKVAFELEAGHRHQLEEATVRKLKNAARQMRKDAEDVQREGADALAAYKKGMKHLEENLTAAKSAFNEYFDEIDEIAISEQNLVTEIETDAKNLMELLELELNGEISTATAKFVKIKDALRGELRNTRESERKITTDLRNLSGKMQREKDEILKQFHADMNSANSHLEDAEGKVQDSQTALTTIKSNKPHGRSCSSSKKHNWEQNVKSAERKLQSARGELKKAQGIVDDTEVEKEERIQAVTRKEEESRKKLNNDKDNVRIDIDRIGGDLNVLDTLDSDLIDLHDAQKEQHDLDVTLQEQVDHLKRLREVSAKEHTMLFARAEANKTLAQNVREELEKNHTNNISKMERKDIAPSKPVQSSRSTILPSSVKSTSMTFTTSGLPWSLSLDLSRTMPDNVFHTAKTWNILIERRHVGTIETPVLLSFEIPKYEFIADFTSYIVMEKQVDPQNFWLPGFYDVALDANETNNSPATKKFEGLLTTFFIPDPDSTDEENDFNILQESVHSFQRIATSDVVSEITDGLSGLFVSYDSKINLIKEYADRAEDEEKLLYNNIISEFKDLEDKLIPSLLLLKKLKDQAWWDHRMDIATNANTTDASHRLERLLQAVHVVEGALHGRLSDPLRILLVNVETLLGNTNNMDEASVLETLLRDVDSTLTTILDIEPKSRNTAELMLGHANTSYAEVFMDISEAISKVNAQIRHFHLVQLEHDMTSSNDIETAKQAESAAEEDFAQVISRRDQDNEQFAKAINELQQEIDDTKEDLQKAKQKVTQTRQMLLEDKHETVEALVDLRMAEKNLELHVDMQNEHLSEMRDKVNDAFDAASGIRNRQDPSVAGNRVQEAQDRIDAYKISELAHLVSSAGQHAQAAAENGKKAAAIYEEIMKKQSTAFASVKATADWEGSDESLECTFAALLGFTLNIDLFFFKIHVSFDPLVSIHMKLNLDLILQLVDNAFELIWKAIKDAF